MRYLSIVFVLILLLSCSNDDNKETSVESVEWSELGCEETLSVNPDLPYICLEWLKTENAEEYIIFYSESLDGEFIELARTTELNYRNTELAPNKVFFFYIVASNSRNGLGGRSSKNKEVG